MDDAAFTPTGNPLRTAWRFLGQQRTGITCAFLSAALLGGGSLFMDASPEVYRGLSMDDVRFFFNPWRWEHLWFYALATALAVWAASSLVCTWDSVVSRLRRRITRPSAYGAPLLHVTFVLALVAHLWGGLATTSGRHMVSASPSTIDDATWRAIGLEQETHPNGMPRAITARLERTTAAGTEQVAIGYNHPLTAKGGARELLLAQVDSMPDGLLIRHKGQLVVLRSNQQVTAGGDTLALRRFHDPRRNPSLRVPVVELAIGAQGTMLPLDPEGAGETVFLGMNESPVVVLMERNNPSVPLVLAVPMLLVAGVVLVAWERIRTTRQAAESQP